MYGVAGERRLTEFEVPWLPGYEGSRPVRIGNAASDQLQLDVYGEVHGRAPPGAAAPGSRPTTRPGRSSAKLLEHLEDWSGESRTRGSGRCAARGAHFTHSKVMAWVAFDRAVKAVEQLRRGRVDVDRWKRLRGTRSTSEVCREGFDAERGSFVQSYGSDDPRREPAR